MSVTVEQASQGSRVRLAGSITVNCAAELHRALLDALHTKQNIEMDMEQTTELDASAIQLLYRACVAAGNAGLCLEPAGVLPSVVEAAFRDAGLDPFQRAAQVLGVTK